MTEIVEHTVELRLREELARGDATMADVAPVLRHLLTHDDRSLLGDETIARIRGMMTHLAAQLLFAQGEAAGAGDLARYIKEREDDLARLLAQDAELLAHAHAVTTEAQLTERLQRRSGIDAVVSPMVQDLAAANEAHVAELAMAVLAAQARFMQHHRRMELPLGELPGDLFHRVLMLHRSHSGDDGGAEATGQRLRTAFDEGAGRLGLLTRLAMAIGEQAQGALAVERAGVAIFATALSMACKQERRHTVLAIAEGPSARLALSLRAAGLSQTEVEQQLVQFHSEAALPAQFDRLPAGRAAALLAETSF